MRAGTLRHLVTVQKNTPTTSGTGDRVDAWTAVGGKVSSCVKFLTGRELYVAQQVNAEATISVCIRYRSDLVAKQHRLLYGSRVLNIVNVAPDERHREVELLCVEVA
jgi:SPP1 family predicted phage head-tail adaptor